MTKIPDELIKAKEKALNYIDFYENMIKKYTDKWVSTQENIIELDDAIKKLKEK